MNAAALRELERDSIFEFLGEHAHLFDGADVLDLGCGKQPYRRLVEAHGGYYHGWDRKDLPASTVSQDVGKGEPLYWPAIYDVILCTQVIQYVPFPSAFIGQCARALKQGGGRLIITGPTNWPFVEAEDKWRFTPQGIQELIDPHFAHYSIHERATLHVEDIKLLLGWGAVAWR